MIRKAHLLVPLLVSSLAACTFGGPRMTSEERQTLNGCKAEADRIFAAQNRYQLSERQDRDAPYAGSSVPYDPQHGLADRYQQDQLIDSCVARSGISKANNTPAQVTK